MQAYHAAETRAEFEESLRATGYIPARKTSKGFSADDGAREEQIIMRGREAVGYVIRCLNGEFGPFVQGKIQQSWNRRKKNLNPPQPDTACTLLDRLSSEMRRQGLDLDLSELLRRRPNRPISVPQVLEYLAAEYRRRHPGAQFIIQDGRETD